MKKVAWEGPGTSSGDLAVRSRRFVNLLLVEREGWSGTVADEALEVVAAVITEHALLDGLLELLPVARLERRCLVEFHPSLFGLREDPVEDDDVVVEVGVEAGPEAVQKRDGADLALGYRRWSPGTCGMQAGADRTKEDSQDAACHFRIAVEVGSQPFRNREHSPQPVRPFTELIAAGVGCTPDCG